MEIKDLEVVSTSSGVYLWKDKNNNVIYIGKAKNLRKRMKQYLEGYTHSYKTYKMVSKIASFETIVVKNEKEALILERNLIKHHKPKYNILLMDDKHLPYIKVSLNKTLEIKVAYKCVKKIDTVYYGPFPAGYGARDLVKFLEGEFLYENGIPIRSRNRFDWEEKFAKVKTILSFKDINYLKTLEKNMHLAAAKEQFEIASEMKRFLNQLAKLQEKQDVQLYNQKNMDVIAVFQKDNLIFFMMLFYRYGVLLNSKETTKEVLGTIEITIENFLNYHYKNNFIPERIILNHEFKDFDFALDFKSKLEFPQRGQTKEVLNTAFNNLKNNLINNEKKFLNKGIKIEENLETLKSLLQIKKLNNIVIIDNSHTGHSDVVSVILVYIDGIQSKTLSRGFNIKSSKNKSDTHYIAIGIEKFLNSNPSMPDLIIADGGLAQIRAIKKVLKSQKLQLPVIGLVKNDKHATEYLIDLKEESVEIKNRGELFLFLKGMQEDVDKFAKNYHQKKKINAFLKKAKTS